MLDALKNQLLSSTYTENGAKAFATTNSSMLDFFAQAGAMRERPEQDIVQSFMKAFAEDQLLALKALFFFRDIRGGQGERRIFRTIIKFMANNHPQHLIANIDLIAYFGRWDDVYTLIGTRCEKAALTLIANQYSNDIKTDKPSLLGKWIKSENATSDESKRLGKITREFIGCTPRTYRKSISALRQQIRVVEREMSAREWATIQYSQIPSKASMIYKKAFMRHDEERYRAYLESVSKGEAKINAKTLYPYEIVEKVLQGDGDQTLELLWDNLPDYFDGKTENSIVVADVSGSMSGRPIAVSISLAMYVAERNKGAFHNHFMTFSAHPELVQIQGKNLITKVRAMARADWGANTDIEAVFSLILETAVQNKLTQEQIVEKIYIVSDMEFDAAKGYRNNISVRANTPILPDDVQLFSSIAAQYELMGYRMPKLVFWNVNARNEQFPEVNKAGVQLISGCSPSIFKTLLKDEFVSAYDLMLEVLNDERYSVVTANV